MNELKKADEVVRALRDYASDCDSDSEYCFQCTFAWVCDKFDNNAPKIIADLIDSLTAQLTESQRREKAAAEDLSTYKDCGFCVHIQDQQYCYKNCQRHVDVDNFRTYPCWEWRGPQAEKGEADGN